MITHRSVATLGSPTLASFLCSVNDDWALGEGIQSVIHGHLSQVGKVRPNPRPQDAVRATISIERDPRVPSITASSQPSLHVVTSAPGDPGH